MTNSVKQLAWIALLSCILGYAVSLAWEWTNTPHETVKTTTKNFSPKKRFTVSGRTQPNVSHEQLNENGELYLFVKKLQGKLTTEEYSKLFEDTLATSSSFLISLKMDILLEKWGDAEPRQALKKVLEAETSDAFWAAGIFGKWATKAPENALGFYNEAEDDRIKKNPYIPLCLSNSIAKYDPQKAWDWLQSQKAHMTNYYFEWAQSAIVSSVATYHPELIPEFIKKLDVNDMKQLAFTLGSKSGEAQAEAPEWIEQLAPETKLLAEAGRIKGSAKGDLKKIQEQVASWPNEQQIVIVKQLAHELLAMGGLNTQDKVDWILNTIPENELDAGVKGFIRKWLYEDRENAKKWIDSLPPGSKKNNLLKLYEHDGISFIL